MSKCTCGLSARIVPGMKDFVACACCGAGEGAPCTHQLTAAAEDDFMLLICKSIATLEPEEAPPLPVLKTLRDLVVRSIARRSLQ